MMAIQRIVGAGELWRSLRPVLLALSPDGRWLAFTAYSSTANDRNDLYLLDLASAEGTSSGSVEPEPLLIVQNVVVASVLSWRPDGQYLLFASLQEDGKSSLCTLALVDRTVSRIPLPFDIVHEARWSPDGRSIALLATAATGTKDAHKGCQLYLCAYQPGATYAGSPLRQLTQDASTYEQLSWMPDGEEIVVVAREPDAAHQDAGTPRVVVDLLAFQAESTHMRVLTEHTLSDIAHYASTPDGRALMVIGTITAQPQPQLYLVTRQGNTGDHILAVSPDLEHRLYAVSDDSERSMRLPGQYLPQWDAAGQTLYFLTWESQEPRRTMLNRLDTVWRSQRQLTPGDGVISFIALLTQYDQLLYAQRASDGSFGLYRLLLEKD